MDYDLIFETLAFDNFREARSVRHSSINLWHTLALFAYKRGQCTFELRLSVLESKTSLSRKVIWVARNELQALGLIEYETRKGSQSTVYTINSFAAVNQSQMGIEMDTKNGIITDTEKGTKTDTITGTKKDTQMDTEKGTKMDTVNDTKRDFVEKTPQIAQQMQQLAKTDTKMGIKEDAKMGTQMGAEIGTKEGTIMDTKKDTEKDTERDTETDTQKTEKMRSLFDAF